MKRLSMLMFAVLFCFLTVNAQENLKVETFYLDNGLKVVLCEDHSAPTIHGTVYVHAGSKNDPLDATGMAHYFEHIMFKGTDKIGTIDWEKEKVYLDSIEIMYDKLHDSDELIEIESIINKINELSQASSEYVIPNELDVILNDMGCIENNAFTSFDYTIYKNIIPSNQVEKWMDVCVERFCNPVFRMFQNELATIYAEKNMMKGSRTISSYMNEVRRICYGKHPYSNDIIGSSIHLMTPQISRMREFYDTYYVANNMTLIIVGDFDTDSIKPLISEKFSILKKGDEFQHRYTVPNIREKSVKTLMSPIKIGSMVYNGVDAKHDDYIVLKLICYMLSNGETGMFDKLIQDDKVNDIQIDFQSLEDCGFIMIHYLNNMYSNRKKSEKMIYEILDAFKSGNFSDDLFEAVKMDFVVSNMLMNEDINNIVSNLINLEIRGMTYEEYLSEIESVRNLSKEDLIKVVNKYFNDKHYVIRTKKGFPLSEPTLVPKWQTIDTKNTDKSSDFAKSIKERDMEEVNQQVIEYGKDVVIEQVNDAFTMFSSKNPHNNIFSITIEYNYGMLDNPDMRRNVMYWSLLGSKSMTYEEIKIELGKLGAYFNTSYYEDRFVFSIIGFEEYIDEILSICEDKIYNPSYDKKKLALVRQNELSLYESAKYVQQVWNDAVTEYVLYGDSSIYMLEPPLINWINKGEDMLFKEIQEPFNYGGSIVYTGNIDNKIVLELLASHKLINNDAKAVEKKYRTIKQYDEDMFYFAHNAASYSNEISIYVPSEVLTNIDEDRCKIFNEYFGIDSYSIMYQEIRESRSLAYMSMGLFVNDYTGITPGFLYAILSTHPQKTNEAVEVMRNVITDMPKIEHKYNTAKKNLLSQVNTSFINSRQIPFMVKEWNEMGYNYDPRIEIKERLESVDYDGMIDFYNTKIKNKPIIITVVGNKNFVNIKKLKQYGNFKYLKFNKIYQKP